MNKTKIDWCDYTWNPVTGCLHGCEYCYARGITKRFGGGVGDDSSNMCKFETLEGGLFKVCKPLKKYIGHSGKTMTAPYPFGFAPTFHHYRLDEPQQVQKPSKIFVVSMGDLFGDWVPDEWIQEIFKACEAAPQHTYMFLTKNGSRYEQLGLLPDNDNFWYGTTRTGTNPRLECGAADHKNTFLSLEPLFAPLDNETLNAIDCWGWVIIGQQTNPNRPPKDKWVQNIIDQCRAAGVPVFVKNPLYEKFPIQEWPEGLRKEMDK